jgi:16S rRNA (cytidine1402-2'-O)-methyltransferase
LYIVGTPIGNLEDITLRALRALREADLIAAEDTRHTRKLLSHYDIHTPLTSYHEHNKKTKGPQLIAKLLSGTSIALVSNAGMPGISDPGHDLIIAALEKDIEVTIVPGPSALLSALVMSGLPTHEFAFLGFPPRKAGERKEFVERALKSDKTIILFEATNRLINLLELTVKRAPDRKAAVARELTKKFEQVIRGTPDELLEHFRKHEPKGECVVLIEGSSQPLEQASEERLSSTELVERLMQEGVPKKEAMREAARRLGLSRRAVYDMFLKGKRQQ